MTQRCPNGRMDENQPHDFDVPTQYELIGMPPVMYCRQCGEVRALAITHDDGPVNEATPADLRRMAGDVEAYRRERGYIKGDPS